ncbi:ATP-binding cassette domain-containing protein [Myroides sp. WP-1]|uniref:ATP-binding cassette domain-containing protein n=1 Tax=Myroides sp. WP-1 TaxID=2759944 RepID=UPI0015F9A20B|nr:ATP-binding cassette domain-containing protein [Myroides sp. WP-1]MBB1139774.1 ATP-binding cassette domain-containing protein [Myroides sp. WP-1]
MSTLYLDSLVYQVNSKTILNNIYFQMQTGELIELIGSNGAGKSTFLEVLFGTKKPQHIHIKIDQKLIRNSNRLQRYFALKPQFSFFPKQLRLKDVLPQSYWNWVDFEAHLNQPISSFSTGIQQLIQTLFVLELPQPFILLDEPFAGLSPLLQEQLLTVLQQKIKTKGILIVNHIPHLLTPIRTRQIQLQNGNLVQLT